MKKKNIIKKHYEFVEIIKNKHFVKSKEFVVYYRKNSEDITRIGILVSKKNNGIAIRRNKIKRQIKDILDDYIDYKKDIDLIIVVSKYYDTNKFKENKMNLENLLDVIKGDFNE